PRLLTVRVRADDEVWAVGGLQLPEVWRFDGTDWVAPDLAPCVGQALNGVVTAPNEPVHIAGTFGVAASVDDGTWTCEEAPVTPEHFHAAWAFDDEVLAVGGNLFATTGHYATVARFPARGALTFSGACE
ncbi:MAG: hypothetical protein AAF602_19610, partial [Myxococcota bacterium]